MVGRMNMSDGVVPMARPDYEAEDGEYTMSQHEFDAYSFGALDVEYVIADSISLYIAPLLLIIGIFSNLVSIIVMVRLGVTTLSSCFYLAILGGIDIYLLCVRAGNDWAKHVWSTDITATILSQSNVSCQVYSFISSFFLHLCGWTLAVALIEFAIVTHRPEKAHTVCTTERVKNVLLVVVLFLVCVNAHFFWTYGLVSPYATATTVYCTFTPFGSYYSDIFRDKVWPVMNNLASAFAPHFVIIGCLGVKVAQRKFSQEKTERLAANHFIMNRQSLQSYGKVCIVLGTVSLMFTLPETCYNLFEVGIEKWGAEWSNHPKFYAQRTLAQSICYTFRDIYLSGKIVVYLICWPDFRLGAVSALSCRRCRMWVKKRKLNNENRHLIPKESDLMVIPDVQPSLHETRITDIE